MQDRFGAMSLGESQYNFKTDVGLIFGRQRKDRQYVLRTTIHSLSVWKTRNPGVSTSPFKLKNMNIQKDAAVIDKEVWVFNINGTVSQDIVASVKLASQYYKVSPSVILSDIYAKNLNVDRENDMSNQSLIRANKDLYSNICKTIIQAARQLGISSEINFYVFSRNDNNKIPGEDLHEALTDGGAKHTKTDQYRYKVVAGSNDNSEFITQMTNFHMASMKA
ncbi:hypothetical protein MO867_02050 [Microbulbifer sp. OS29]|uniref:Uncharacterized protein n=1 Tax=Microbulbifer okhotskensis TaxID=2926617 RepID=A0A9X2EP20_9GAMM|nr:hypothetical protein [Microbulbifer okhotskensis]MCO1333113.1 hypothetical protein [Microbulbifer okhotskensis]